MELTLGCERAWFKDQLERQKQEAEEALNQAREEARMDQEAFSAMAAESRHEAERRAVADERRAMEEVSLYDLKHVMDDGYITTGDSLICLIWGMYGLILVRACC